MKHIKIVILGCAMLLLSSCSIFGWDPLAYFSPAVPPETTSSASSASTDAAADTSVHPAAPDTSYLTIAPAADGQMYLGKSLSEGDALTNLDAVAIKAANYRNLPPETSDAPFWKIRLPNRDTLAYVLPSKQPNKEATLYIYAPAAATAHKFQNSGALHSGVSFYDWVGNNLILSYQTKTQSGIALVSKNEFFLFDTTSNDFSSIPAYGILALPGAPSELHYLQNPAHGGVFALAACTDSNLAGVCREYDIALSNSQMIRDVATIPSAGNIEWGWKDPGTLFVKQQQGGGSGSIFVMNLARLRWDAADVPIATLKTSILERYRNAQIEVTSKLTEDERKMIYQQLQRIQSNPKSGSGQYIRTLFEDKGVAFTEDNILIITTEGTEKYWGESLDIERALFIDRLPIDTVLDLCLKKSDKDTANIPSYVQSMYSNIPLKITERGFCILRIGSQNLGALDTDESFRQKYMPAGVILPAPKELQTEGSGSYGPRIMATKLPSDPENVQSSGSTTIVQGGTFVPIDISGPVEAAYKKALCAAVGKKTKTPLEKTLCQKMLLNRFESKDTKYILGLCGTGLGWDPLPKKCDVVLGKKEKEEFYVQPLLPAQKTASIQGAIDVEKQINILWFDLEFNPPNADGIVRVSLDGEQIATIYERFVPKGVHTYQVQFDTIGQGKHTIKFAADGLNAELKSAPKVNRVRAGFQQAAPETPSGEVSASSASSETASEPIPSSETASGSAVTPPPDELSVPSVSSDGASTSSVTSDTASVSSASS